MMVKIFQSVTIALSATINGRKFSVHKYYPGIPGLENDAAIPFTIERCGIIGLDPVALEDKTLGGHGQPRGNY